MLENRKAIANVKIRPEINNQQCDSVRVFLLKFNVFNEI